MRSRQFLFPALFLVFIFLSGLGIFHILNSDFGKISVSEVYLPNSDQRICGLLYRPIQGLSPTSRLAGVVLAHGISSSKQSLSAIALELSKRGLVSLAIDLVGHGSSDGSLGASSDPSLGVLAAVQYLEAQLFVDPSRVGLIGHSLGAGAIRAAAATRQSIRALVFMGGGLGDMVAGPAYGSLNTTFPKNLLIAVGRDDVLFDIDGLKTELSPVFNLSQVVEGQLYGDFARQTARKLIIPTTIHLFEPLDPRTVSETVAWMENALLDMPSPTSPAEVDLTYVYREAALSAASVAVLGLVFPLSTFKLTNLSSNKGVPWKAEALEDWKVFIILGMLGLGTLFPMFLVGLIIPFPPLIFGSSFAWWLLSVAILGLLLAKTLLPRISCNRLELKPLIVDLFSRSSTATIPLLILLVLYGTTSLVEAVFATDLRVVTPLLSAPRLLSRILLVPVFLPFFLAYFLVDGLYLHVIRGETGGQSGLASAARDILLKASPYMLVLSAQYLPMLFLGIRPLAGMTGFLVEFLWGIVPLFIVTTAFSSWLYRKTSSIGPGAVLNALIFAWSAASVFPFRG